MMARFLKDDDVRLDQQADFEVQKVNDKGEIVDTDWHINSTFNTLFDLFDRKLRKGSDISILDYGDELCAVITPLAKSHKHHYSILMS